LPPISAIFVMPYYPAWSLISIAIAIIVSYGLAACRALKPDDQVCDSGVGQVGDDCSAPLPRCSPHWPACC
jgi:hypothetical protein